MRRLLPVLALIVACGNKDEPRNPSNVDVSKTNTPQVNVATKRGPSKEMGDHWVIGPKLETVVWADLKSVASSELVKGVVPTLLSIPDFPEEPKKCIKAVLAQGQEVLIGVVEDRRFAAMRVDGTLENVCPRGPLSRHEHIGYAPGWVYYGDEDLVKSALAGKGGGLPTVNAGADDVVYVSGTPMEGASFEGALVLNNQRMKASLDASLPSEEMAKEFEGALKQGKERGKEVGKELVNDKTVGPIFDHLMQSWTFSRTGSKLHAQLELVEGPEDQARDVGVMATLGIFAVRKYIANAKGAEARNACGQIAKDIVAWYEAEDVDPKGKPVLRDKKKLFSLPPIPKDVPKGMKYQSSQADWKPWAAIRFEMSQPQYFQYEVKAAKDGKSADVIARGDLNGDGKTSEFKLSMVMKDGRILVSPAIMETNPEE